MADETKVYLTAYGQVQAFVKSGVKQDAVRVGTSNGQTVYNCTIKTDKFDGQGKPIYVEFAFWSGDWGDAPAGIQEGFFIWADGQYKAEGDQGQFHKITPMRAVVVPCMKRLPREVVNQAAPAQLGGGFPGAQPVATASTVAAQPTAEQVAAFLAAQAQAAQAQVGQNQQPAAQPAQVAPNPFGGQAGF